MDEHELEPLLALDGAEFEMAQGIVVQFAVRRIEGAPARLHGISYVLVLRPKAGGPPWLRFDNAHGVAEGAGVIGAKERLMTIGTEPEKTRVSRTTSQRRCSYWMIFGARSKGFSMKRAYLTIYKVG